MRRIRLLSPCVTASGHVKQTGSDPPALAGRNFDFNHGYSGDLLYGLTLIFSVDQLTAYMPVFGIFFQRGNMEFKRYYKQIKAEG